MINYTSIDFRNDRLKKIQRLLSDLAPHEHADGINECAICDQGLDEAILIELRKVPTPVRQEEGEWRGRVRDALVVAFITGCHCGGKNNPDWRNHAEHCPAAYFGRAIEEFDSINASLRDKTEQEQDKALVELGSVTATTREGQMERLLDSIDLALRANSGGAEPADAWHGRFCRCDPDVGATPCEYCAIYEALTKSRRAISVLLGSSSDGSGVSSLNSSTEQTLGEPEQQKTNSTFAEWAESAGWVQDECPESWTQGEEIWNAARLAAEKETDVSAGHVAIQKALQELSDQLLHRAVEQTTILRDAERNGQHFAAHAAEIRREVWLRASDLALEWATVPDRWKSDGAHGVSSEKTSCSPGPGLPKAEGEDSSGKRGAP